MENIWRVVAEISCESKIGFMNITTWANSGEEAEAKIRDYLESFGWHLISIEKAETLDEGSGTRPATIRHDYPDPFESRCGYLGYFSYLQDELIGVALPV